MTTSPGPPSSSAAVIDTRAGATAVGHRERATGSLVRRLADRHALLLTIAVASVVRAAVLVVDPKPGYLAGLRSIQTEMANALLDHGRWFVVLDHGHYRPQVLEMPGLALVDAAVWSVTGSRSYLAIKCLQLLVDVGMVALVYWIGVRLTGHRRVGIASAALYAIWPAAAVLAATPSLDAWAASFLVAATAAFVWLRESPTSPGRMLLLGSMIGIGVYFRPTLIVLPALLAVVAIPGRRRKVVAAVVPTLVAVSIVAPWTIRNAYEFHAFIPTRSGFGQSLWEGLGQGSNTFGAVSDDNATNAYVLRLRPDLVPGTPAFDAYLTRKSLRAVAEHPGFYLGLVVRRSIYLLPCLLALLWRRRWTRERLLLATVAFATIAPYALLRMETRFWVPAAFAYILLAVLTLEAGRVERDGPVASNALPPATRAGG